MTKILVVDDSPTVRTQVQKLLKSWGHDTLEAGDGLEGLDVLKNNSQVELIICDVNMPNMDGLSMCEKVREMDQGSDIPILMLTTESNKELKDRGRELKVMGWMTKPLNREMLKSVIDKVSQAAS